MPPTRGYWAACGACTSVSTAPLRGATRRASGGAATTSTTGAERSHGEISRRINAQTGISTFGSEAARRIDVMPTITTQDGIEIFYKDWGSGQPIVFSHGWPLSADDWDTQMLFFMNHGFRVIGHDRRGHGPSSQVGDGHDMDHYADDLAALTAHLDLENAVHVGHSTGGGEVVHYIARHGESRVAKAAIISAV